MLKNLLACSMLLKSLGLFAQTNTEKLSATTTQHPTAEIDWENFDQYLENIQPQTAAPDWVFHQNLPNRVLLVNLANKAAKATRLAVKSSTNAALVFEDADLAELSPNAIYEIDLARWNTDTYVVVVEYEDTKSLSYELIWSKN
jgi:hypothetical protein